MKQRITTVIDEQGQIVSVDLGLGDGPKDKPNYNLYDKMPPGKLVGSIDMGEINIYEQSDGRLMRCRHFFPCIMF